jgi:hypothetical protein
MAIQAFNTHLDIDRRPLLDPRTYEYYNEHSFHSLFDQDLIFFHFSVSMEYHYMYNMHCFLCAEPFSEAHHDYFVSKLVTGFDCDPVTNSILLLVVVLHVIQPFANPQSILERFVSSFLIFTLF